MPEENTTKETSSVSKSALGDLLDALKPFARSAEGIEWDDTPDHLEFWPINALKPNACPLLSGDMKKAMKIYRKYKKYI